MLFIGAFCGAFMRCLARVRKSRRIGGAVWTTAAATTTATARLSQCMQMSRRTGWKVTFVVLFLTRY